MGVRSCQARQQLDPLLHASSVTTGVPGHPQTPPLPHRWLSRRKSGAVSIWPVILKPAEALA